LRIVLLTYSICALVSASGGAAGAPKGSGSGSGNSLAAQVAHLRARPDIIVATPGRLADHLRAGNLPQVNGFGAECRRVNHSRPSHCLCILGIRFHQHAFWSRDADFFLRMRVWNLMFINPYYLLPIIARL
jgi:hypothetical protein